MTNTTLRPGPAIGLRVREIRERQGIGRPTLTRKARVGRNYLEHLETGLYDNPGIAHLMALARGLGVTVGELLGETPRDGAAEIERLRGVIREIRYLTEDGA